MRIMTMIKINFTSGYLLLISLFVLFSCGYLNNDKIMLQSPDGNLRLEFKLKTTKDQKDFPCYSVSFRGKLFVNESNLSIEFAETGLLKNNLTIKNVAYKSNDETYKVILGKSNTARDHYNEVIITFVEKTAPNRQFDLVFRAYDDGIAFRYLFPQQTGLTDFIITSENSCFTFTGNPKAYALPLGKFTTSYENNYVTIPIQDITPDSLIGMPLLLEYPENIWVAIMEANLIDYAGMYLSGLQNHPGTLVSSLSPLPGQTKIKVKSSTPHSSPWRVLMIADSPGKLIESNLILNLSDPCAIPDPSWIKPGKAAFLWWNDFVVSDVNFKGGLNTKTYKYYIDFCAENKIEFFDIDTDEKIDWYESRKNLKEDITKPIPEIDMQEILRYARSKDVGVRLWIPWFFVRDQMDKAFPVYEKWGITGLKIDYMDRDDQEMVNFYHTVVKKAAEHHLTVNFHGAYKPTGLRRTYPNLITREGVLGMEYSKWSTKCNPDHDLMIPFTRMLAGPMDFTPGAFRTVTEKDFKPSFHAPVAMGTRCHQLAMYVVYESPLQMISDYPSAYQNQTGIEFLRQVPTVWDTTKVLNAGIGDFITIVRRHGNEWYAGSMTDWTPRELKIPLNFLSEGDFVADIYSDTPDADTIPTHVVNNQYLVNSKDTIIARLSAGGGQVIRLSPAPPNTPLPKYFSEK